MRRFASLMALAALFILLSAPSSATTFHGDVQRTGNFTAEKEILPIVAWKQELSGLVDGSPVYSDGKIYVVNWYGWGSWNPGLYCLNATTGEILWRNENIQGASSPAVYGDVVVVGNFSGHLHYVNSTTGVIEKSVLLEQSPSWYGIASSPLIYNGSVYVATFSNGTLWKLDLNGSILWKCTTGGEISPYTSPAAYGNLIFFAGNESGDKLLAVYENGTVAWKFPVEGKVTNSPSVGEGKVFIATDKKLYAVNSDGGEAWNVSFSGSLSTAAIAYGNIYVGSKDGKLYCFNATSGKEIWNFTANGKIDSSPAVANGVVYFATNTQEGTIYAVDAFNGKLLWFYRLKPPEGSYYNIMSSPFIADNRLFIGADDGHVYCFNSTGWMKFNVTLVPVNKTITVNGTNYEIREDTALGALMKASNHEENGTEIGFEITLDDSWYESYGSFLISSIMGVKNAEDWSEWWGIWNETSPLFVGANQYQVRNGEKIYYGYGDGSSLENCSVVLEIHANVKPIVEITNLTVSSGKLGGNATAWANVTSFEEGWFVLVISGLNEQGDCIAGISTFHLKEGESLRVPVLLHIPQRNTAGNYSLHAGIYKLSEYPERISEYTKVPVNCTVS